MKDFLRRGAYSLYMILIAPRSSEDNERRQEYILNIILLSSIVLLASLDLSVLYYSLWRGPGYNQLSFENLSAILGFFLCAYALSRKGYIRIAAFLVVSEYGLSLAYGAYRWGVNLPAVVLGYALLIVIASILMGTGFGFLLTGVMAVFVITLWFFQFHLLLPPVQAQIPNGSDGLVLGLLLLVIMTVSWLANREISRSLARARHSESLLLAKKRSLEVKVKERTRQVMYMQSEKLEQLHRLAEFGTLATGIFHDLMNAVSTLTLGSNSSIPELKEIRAASYKVERFARAMKKEMREEKLLENFSIGESIEQVISLLDFKARRANVVIDLSLGEKDLYLGDQVKFQRVMMNLIANAIESFDGMPAARDCRVAISVEATKDVIRITVEDNGCGMASEIASAAFEPFFSTKQGTAKEGIGIGLTSARRIVEQDFRGQLTVFSRENKGSRFLVELPLFPVSPPV